MRDLIAEGLFLFSALATIVIMLLIIAKERRTKRTADRGKKAKEYAKTSLYHRPEGLHLD
jgi:hypothetical protein